jgi:hypothetical protein
MKTQRAVDGLNDQPFMLVNSMWADKTHSPLTGAALDGFVGEAWPSDTEVFRLRRSGPR